VAVREAIAGRDALIAKAGLLKLERLAGETELEIRRAVEVGPDVLQILLEVPERERHGREANSSWPDHAFRSLSPENEKNPTISGAFWSAPERTRTSDLRFRRRLGECVGIRSDAGNAANRWFLAREHPIEFA
jgi:hypothetical protein